MRDDDDSEHGIGTTAVAPDGSPVALYLALRGDAQADLIHGAIPRGAAILELGCGVGRVSRCLVQLGHEVTGVDSSRAMLRHAGTQVGVDVIRADARALDLAPRRWPVVVMASHLINSEDGQAFLASAARHVEPSGCVLVERHEPGWVDSVEPSTNQLHNATIEIRDIVHSQPGVVAATMAYVIGETRYEQPFVAQEVDDARLAGMASTVGLRIDAILTDDRKWIRLLTEQSTSI